MVAFNSSRRRHTAFPRPLRSPIDVLTQNGNACDATLHASASHRATSNVETRTTVDGQIAQVRIGRWRVLASAENRRLAEVRELSCRRVAVRIERFADGGAAPSSEIWQLYDLDGRLEAAMQSTPDGKFAMLTNYRTRQSCRLLANESGELHTVESWAI